jgi:hypothetical protein
LFLQLQPHPEQLPAQACRRRPIEIRADRAHLDEQLVNRGARRGWRLPRLARHHHRNAHREKSTGHNRAR